MKSRSCVPVVRMLRWSPSSSKAKLFKGASRSKSASVSACHSMSALNSTSFRDQPSTFTEPFGAPSTVTVPPNPIRRVSWKLAVRLINVGGVCGTLFFCDALNEWLKTMRRVKMRIAGTNSFVFGKGFLSFAHAQYNRNESVVSRSFCCTKNKNGRVKLASVSSPRKKSFVIYVKMLFARWS